MEDSFNFTSSIIYYSCYTNDYYGEMYDKNTEKMCIRIDRTELDHILQTTYDLYDDNKLINIGNVKEYIENKLNDVIVKYNHDSNYNSRMWIDKVLIIKLEEDTDLEELEMKYNETTYDLLHEIYISCFVRDDDEDEDEIIKSIFVILFEISVLPKGKPFMIIKGVK